MLINFIKTVKRLKPKLGRTRDKILPNVILLAAEPLSVFVILRCLEAPWHGSAFGESLLTAAYSQVTQCA